MKSKINIKRVSLEVVSASAVLLLTLPLIAGAQPESMPTGGNVIPTFYGLNINNGSLTGLNINQNGQLNNPADSINGGIVTVEDSQGLRIKQSTIMLPAIMIPRTLTFTPYGEIGASGGGSIFSPAITPVTVRDTHGFRVADNAGIAQFSVDGATGTLSNPGTNNNGNVNVGDGFEVNSAASITPPADWIAAGGANPVVNTTNIKAQNGLFTLNRIFKNFSGARKFYEDIITMDSSGSVWEFISHPTCNPGDGCGFPTRSRIKHGTGFSNPIEISSHAGTSIGYLSDGNDGHAFNEHVEVMDVGSSGQSVYVYGGLNVQGNQITAGNIQGDKITAITGMESTGDIYAWNNITADGTVSASEIGAFSNVVGTAKYIGANSTNTSNVACPTGSYVISCGFKSGTSQIRVYSSYSSGGQCYASGTRIPDGSTPSDTSLRAYAICFDPSPL